jgi:hypothetical protein
VAEKADFDEQFLLAGDVSGLEIRGEMERGVGDLREKCRGLREKGVAMVFSGLAVPEKKIEGGAVGEDDPDAWGQVVRKKRKKKEK